MNHLTHPHGPLLFLAALLLACLPGLASAETVRGEVEGLPRSNGFEAPQDAPEIEVGEEVSAEGWLALTDFFDTEIVTARLTLKNDSDAPAFWACSVAVFDEDGQLLGASGMQTFGDEGLAPGEETQLGSLMISLPDEVRERIRGWQVSLHSRDEKF